MMERVSRQNVDQDGAIIHFSVRGMMCQRNCGTTVAQALLAQPCVKFASASFEHSSATVTLKPGYSPTECINTLLTALSVVGFDDAGTNFNGISFGNDDSEHGNAHENTSDGIPLKVLSRSLPKNSNKSRKCANNGNLVIAKFSVSGMSCAACVSKVESLLYKNPGVESAWVALLLESAEVTYNPLLITPQKIAKSLEAVGYVMELQHITSTSSGDGNGMQLLELKVENMSCSACVTAIESCLANLEGVRSIRVDPNVDTVSIELPRDTFKKEQVIRPVGPRDAVEAVLATGHPCSLVLNRSQLGPNQGHSEAEEWRRLLLISFVLAVPLMILHMKMNADDWLGRYVYGGLNYCEFMEFLLATPVQLLVGNRFCRTAYLGMKAGFMGMDFLIAAGTSAAYGFSVTVVLIKAFIDPNFNKPCTFQTAVMLLAFVSLGKVMEAMTRGQTSEGISALIRMQPTQALLVEPSGSSAPSKISVASCPHTTTLTQKSAAVLEGGDAAAGGEKGVGDQVRIIDAGLVQRGDILRVLPGARIPADGEVVEGCSYVDESAFTGEGMPVAKQPGDFLYGGSVNQLGVLIVKATRVGSDTALSQIAALVEAGQASKPPIQVFSDRVASMFAPFVLVLALFTFIAWYVVLSNASKDTMESWNIPEDSDPFVFALLAAVSVAVVACPCALGLATPTAVMVGTGVGVREGILFKGGAAFERAANVNVIVFDKTGTLTEGKPEVTDVIPVQIGVTSDDVLRIAATAELYSEHPVAGAVSRAATLRHIWLHSSDPASFYSEPGKGVKCRALASDLGVSTENKRSSSSNSIGALIFVGTRNWLTANKVNVTPVTDGLLWELESQAKTAVLVAVEGTVIGAIAVSDQPRAEAAEAIRLLAYSGIHTWLMTGDNIRTAASLAQAVGIQPDRVLAELLPAQKSRKVTQLQSEHRAVVGMVGDGINDSPALAAADVGIAIGAGSQVAIEAADVVLVRSDLMAVATALHLSKVVLARIRLNFVWALSYNTIALPLAAGALLPHFGLSLTPPVAAGFMAFSSTLVVLSSLALKLYRPPGKHTILGELWHEIDARRLASRSRTFQCTETASRFITEMVPVYVRHKYSSFLSGHKVKEEEDYDGDDMQSIPASNDRYGSLLERGDRNRIQRDNVDYQPQDTSRIYL